MFLRRYCEITSIQVLQEYFFFRGNTEIMELFPKLPHIFLIKSQFFIEKVNKFARKNFFSHIKLRTTSYRSSIMLCFMLKLFISLSVTRLRVAR